ncbi:MAG: hypothetical protein GY778_08545 [bacterium]|nr:hypothetical protein [bacterium]
MGRLALKILALIRWLLSPESLPSCPAKLPPAQRRPGATRWLLQQSSLPLELEPGGSAHREAAHPSLGLLAPEILPDLPGPAPVPARHLLGLWRWVFGAEKLSYAETSERPPAGPPGMLRGLVSTEHCPLDQPAEQRRRQSVARQLLSSQAVLPESAGRPRRGAGFVGWLAVRETLPGSGPAPRRPARGFLRWLLSSGVH